MFSSEITFYSITVYKIRTVIIMWKQIPISDGRYYINENGEVKNNATGKILARPVFNTGYPVVSFNVNGKVIKRTLHRLVAEAFIPNPNNFPIVLHKDNNKCNFSISNLEWNTYSENNAQAIRDGLNTIPRPDNRKVYELYKHNCPLVFVCKGIGSITDKLNTDYKYYKTNSAAYKFCSQQIPVTHGQFKDWKIKKGNTFNDYPMASE